MGSEMMWLVAGVAYFVAIPAATYLHVERVHRLQWRRHQPVLVPHNDPGVVYRDGDAGTPAYFRAYFVERVGAPAVVKVVATTSLVLGHMFIPGLLVGLLGLIYGGFGVLAIPGLILAARIYSNAFGLLRGEPLAAAEALRLERFAITLNIVVLAAVAAWVFVVKLDALAIFTACYAAVSLLHARGLRIAATHVIANHQGA